MTMCCRTVRNHNHQPGHSHRASGHKPDARGADGRHPHDEPHAHGHAHGPHGRHPGGVPDWLRHAFAHLGHLHAAHERTDTVLETSDRGIWALKVSLAGLGLTALPQLIVVLFSGSVALLADTIHNFGDAATSIPLWIAFSLGKRAATRRFTYGYGRAEDLAGVVIVALILFSAGVAAYESVVKLLDPQPISHLGWVAAAIIGFVGNEAVAIFRIRVGREIGSAALVADGQHSRVDALTSLAVLVGVTGVALGAPILDPLVGLGITIAILFIAKDAAIEIGLRLMDAVEPEVVDGIEQAAAAVSGVIAVHDVRVRWLGHKLQAEVHIVVDEDLPTRASHRLAEEVRHAIFHAEPRLGAVFVHVDPCGHGGEHAHAEVGHHVAKGMPQENPEVRLETE
jgi:cation diffusion facilitator family transporter